MTDLQRGWAPDGSASESRFATCAVFMRRAVKALRVSHVWRERAREVALLLGMAAAVGVPGATWKIGTFLAQSSLLELEFGRGDGVVKSTRRIDRWGFLVYMDDLVIRFQESSDPQERQRLARVHEAVMDRPLKARLAERVMLSD